MKKQILSTVSIAAIVGIILISVPNISAQSDNEEIPSWIKIIAGSWYKGEVSDTTFLNAMTSLIDSEIIVIPGYGKIDIQEEEILPMAFTLTTDKDTYTTNERVIINGTLPNNDIADVVVMMIRSTDEIGVDMMMVTNDKSGTYETYLTAGIHDVMLEDGEYYIRAQYQGEILTKTFTFTVN